MIRSKVTRKWDCSDGTWNYFIHVAYVDDGEIKTICIIGDTAVHVESRYEELKTKLTGGPCPLLMQRI